MPRVFIQNLSSSLGEEIFKLFQNENARSEQIYEIVGSVPDRSEVAAIAEKLRSHNSGDEFLEPVAYAQDPAQVQSLVNASDIAIVSLLPSSPIPESFRFRGAHGLKEAAESELLASESMEQQFSLDILSYFAAGIVGGSGPRRFIAVSSLVTWSQNDTYADEATALGFHEEQYKLRKPSKCFAYIKSLETQIMAAEVEGSLETIVIGAGLIYGGFETQLRPLLMRAWMQPKAPLLIPSLDPSLRGTNFVPCISVYDLAIFTHVLACAPSIEPKKQYLIAVDRTSGHVTLKDLCEGVSRVIGSGLVRLPEDLLNDAELNECLLSDCSFLQALQLNTCFTTGDGCNEEDSARVVPYMHQTMDVSRFQYVETGFLGNLSFFVRDFIHRYELFPLKIVILGAPCAGVSTLAQKLASDYHISLVTLGSVLCELSLCEPDSPSLIPVQNQIRQWKKRVELEEQTLGDEAWGFLALRDLNEDVLSMAVQWKLKKPQCRNQGFVLDNFPSSVSFCEKLYTTTVSGPSAEEPASAKEELTVEKEADKTREALDSLRSMQRSLWPNRVIALLTEKELASQRAQSLQESHAVLTGNTMEAFESRWNTYLSTKDLVLGTFEEHGSKCKEEVPANPDEEAADRISDTANSTELLDNPSELEALEVLDLFLKDEEAYANPELFASAVKNYIEGTKAPHNFHPTLKEIENYRLQKELEKQKEAEEESRIEKERADKKAEEQKLKLLADQRRLEIVAQEEKVLLESRSKPLRQYLMDTVLPALSEGVLEIVRAEPDDPIDFLAEFLFRKGQELEEAQKNGI